MAKYRILSLDGGGIRGLLTAVLLQRLSAAVPGWLDQVDLFAGTSTGGILALGLAHGFTPQDLRQLYATRCADIFDDSWLDDLMDLGRTVGADFSNRKLGRIIKEMVGDITLKELRKKVMIASFDLDNEHENPIERSWKPKFFHNFPGTDSDGDVLVRQVALYTSAAPTIFPAVDGYVDGGVVANNPSLAAVAQVLDERAVIPERPALHEIVLLSMSTGQTRKYIKRRAKYLDWGYAQWARPAIDMLMQGSVGLADFQCRQLLGKKRYLRINPVLTGPLELTDCATVPVLQLLGEAYPLETAVAWLQDAWMRP